MANPLPRLVAGRLFPFAPAAPVADTWTTRHRAAATDPILHLDLQAEQLLDTAATVAPCQAI
jgi:hypothetical protein